MRRTRTVTQKSPLHPSALRLNDLTIGRPIIKFNLEFGVQFEGVVASRPYAGHFFPHYQGQGSERKYLVVELRSNSGQLRIEPLDDMGVVRYEDGVWNPRNFTIDARKRHLLPTPDRSLPNLWTDDSCDCHPLMENLLKG